MRIRYYPARYLAAIQSSGLRLIAPIFLQNARNRLQRERDTGAGQRQSQKQSKHSITYKICLAISILTAYNCPYGQEQSKAGHN